MGVLLYCLLSLGETLLKKGLPQTPTRKLLTIWVKAWMIITTQRLYYCLLFETTEMRRLMGPCFPTGGWFLRGRLNLILFVQFTA